MTEREALLEKQLSESRLENKLLRDKVDALVRMLYGSKSEKLDPGQLMLLEGLESKKSEAPDLVDKPDREPVIGHVFVASQKGHVFPSTCRLKKMSLSLNSFKPLQSYGATSAKK